MTPKPAQHHIAARVVSTLLATHLLPSILVTTMAAALAYGSGQRSSLWLLVPAVLFGQFCVGWTNDYIDRHRDTAAGRIKKPIVSGIVQAHTIRLLAILAFVAAILFSLAYDVVATYVYIVALASALLYNFRLKNSAFSLVSYIVSFGLLPVYVALGSAQPFIPNTWIILALALWGVGVHIQNVVPDFEHDAKTGIKGVANYFTPLTATTLSGVALVLSVGALSVLYSYQAPLYVWVVVGAFGTATAVFIGLLLAKKRHLAYQASMVMSATASLFIMFSGPYLR